MANIPGTNGIDNLVGTVNQDNFIGSAGNDTITGIGIGDGTTYAAFSTPVTVTLAPTLSAEFGFTGTVTKTSGADTFSNLFYVYGGSAADTLLGTTFTGSAASGRGMNLIGGLGNDTINGQSNLNNIASYIDATTGVTVNLATGTASGGGIGTDTLVNVRNVRGSEFADTITGSTFNDFFNSSAGSDRYDGGGGYNIINYGSATGAVTITAAAPNAGLFGLGNATTTRAAGTDTLTNVNEFRGSGFGDVLLGTTANYTFYAYDLRGDAGNDTIYGYSSTANVADYSGAASAVTVDLAAGTASDGLGGTDTLINVVRATASNYNDTLLGGATNDYFRINSLGLHTADGRGGLNTVAFGGSDNVTIDLGTTLAGNGFGGYAGTITKVAGTDTLLNFTGALGGSGNDTIRGTPLADTLGGGQGNNLIDGRDGLDTYRFASGTGTPTIGGTINLADGMNGTATNPWGGTDTLLAIENARGSAYDDTITGAVNGALVSYIRGDGGHDVLGAPTAGTLVTADYTGSLTRVVVNLTSGVTTDDGWFGGSDTLVNIEHARGSANGDLIFGSAVANTLTMGAGDDEAYGLAGADTLLGEAGADSLYGGDDADRLEGGTGADRLFGEAGNDVILGGTDADVLFGGAGTGILLGGDGDDVVVGADDVDYLYGDDGNDYVYAGDANDYVYGGAGADTLYGEGGTDFIFGGDGNDVILGGAGVNVLFGEAGVDVVIGGSEADYAYGGLGDDYVYGGAGDDYLYGDEGTDFLYGDDGNDQITGGSGVDYITGGAGNDILRGGTDLPDVFYHTAGTDGSDVIADFGGGDILVLFNTGYASSAQFLAAAAFAQGSDTVIYTGVGTSVTLAGVTLASLTADSVIVA